MQQKRFFNKLGKVFKVKSKIHSKAWKNNLNIDQKELQRLEMQSISNFEINKKILRGKYFFLAY